MLPKAASPCSGAWEKYKPTQENDPSSAGAPGHGPTVVEVPESPVFVFSAAPPPASRYGNCVAAPKPPAMGSSVVVPRGGVSSDWRPDIVTASLDPSGDTWANPKLLRAELEWSVQERNRVRPGINPVTGSSSYVRPKESVGWTPDAPCYVQGAPTIRDEMMGLKESRAVWEPVEGTSGQSVPRGFGTSFAGIGLSGRNGFPMGGSGLGSGWNGGFSQPTGPSGGSGGGGPPPSGPSPSGPPGGGGGGGGGGGPPPSGPPGNGGNGGGAPGSGVPSGGGSGGGHGGSGRGPPGGFGPPGPPGPPGDPPGAPAGLGVVDPDDPRGPLSLFASMFESQQRMNERLIALQERDRVAKEQKDQWDGDTRLQIKQTIRKITATDSETLWQQFEDLERQLLQNNIRGFKAWYRYLELAIDEDARRWIESSNTREPGRQHVRAALAPGATDDDWKAVYRHARTELFRRAGLIVEPPGENAQRTWDAVVFPKNPSFADITKVLRKLSEARLMMVRCRKFDDSSEALEREMYDLKKKIPLGSPLRLHLYGHGFEPPDFDRFLDSVQRYQFALERGKHEPGRLGDEGGGTGEADWDEYEEDEEEYEEDEPGRALSDGRQAAGGLRGQPRRAPGGARPDDKAKPKAPRCTQCSGYHWVRPCPNDFTAKRGFDARRNPQIRCSFMDERHVGV
jgi:hypothetical protein